MPAAVDSKEELSKWKDSLDLLRSSSERQKVAAFEIKAVPVAERNDNPWRKPKMCSFSCVMVAGHQNWRLEPFCAIGSQVFCETLVPISSHVG